MPSDQRRWPRGRAEAGRWWWTEPFVALQAGNSNPDLARPRCAEEIGPAHPPAGPGAELSTECAAWCRQGWASPFCPSARSSPTYPRRPGDGSPWTSHGRCARAVLLGSGANTGAIQPQTAALIATLKGLGSDTGRKHAGGPPWDRSTRIWFDKGLERRKATLGARVCASASLDGADDFTRPFQEAMTAWCWALAWGRRRPSDAKNPQHDEPRHAGARWDKDARVGAALPGR